MPRRKRPDQQTKDRRTLGGVVVAPTRAVSLVRSEQCEKSGVLLARRTSQRTFQGVLDSLIRGVDPVAQLVQHVVVRVQLIPDSLCIVRPKKQQHGTSSSTGPANMPPL